MSGGSHELPAPPVPADCDLRDFAFMPLHVEQLRRSKAWLICKRKPELGFYMLNLWTAAWHSVPAGSLEDDDDVLCDLAMCDPKRWAKVREEVRRGWFKCKDGRLYHNVVAEKVLDAWQAKIEQRRSTLKARIAKAEKRLEKTTDQALRQEIEGSISDLRQSLSQTCIRPAAIPAPEPVAAPDTGSKREGQGQGQGDSSSDDKSSGAAPPDAIKDLFDFGVRLFARDGRSEPDARKLLGKLRSQIQDDPRLMSLLVAAHKQSAIEPFQYVQGAVRREKTRQESLGGFVPLGVGG